MQLTQSSRKLTRLGLQAMALAAACTVTSSAVLACSQATPPTPERKAALARMQRSFRQLKTLQHASTAIQTKEETPPSIVGMWMTTFTAGGEVLDAGFDVWHSDGTQILNDYPPPATGNVCIGIWQQTGPLTYQLNHPSWAYDPDTNTNVVGITYILEKITLDPSGEKFTGTASLEGYDLDGNHIFHQDAEVSGDRIKIDPPADAGPLPQMRLFPYLKSTK